MKKIFQILLISLVLAGNTFGQKKQIAKGDKAYNKKEYPEAAALYEEAISKGASLNNKTKIKIANCYYYASDFEKAKKYFSEVEENELDGVGAVNYGRILQSNEEYDKAASLFVVAKAKGISPDKVKKYQDACFWAKENTAVSKEYDVESMELTNIFGGVKFFKEGLVFSYNPSADKAKKGMYYSDIYFATYLNGKLGIPKIFSSKLKLNYPTDALAFSADGNKLLFTKVAEAKKEGSKLNSKIFEANFDKNSWVLDSKIASFNSDKFSCMHPAWMPDGETLIFSSDMPGGLGGKDLYKVTYKDKKWGKPVNLGDKINTTGDEVYPYVAADKTLFFSSDGHKGYGGLDLFSSHYVDGNWGDAKNLGKPINSPKNDYGYVDNPEDPTNSLLLSSRDGSGSVVKLYMIIKKELSADLNDIKIPFDATTNATAFQVPNDTIKSTAANEEGKNLTLEQQLKLFMTDGKDIVYKVQFLSTKEKLDIVNMLKTETVYRYEFQGLQRYVVGEFYSPEPAIAKKDEMIKKGYKDAFVVVFKGNERILDVPVYKKSTEKKEATEEKK